MSQPYEIVERPTYGSRANEKHDYAAIIATATTGKAVRVPLRGATAGGLRASIREGARRRGYKAHALATPDALIVWCDKRPGRN